ncbi:tryptophan synthase alpha chain [Desulfosarcina alkanivorans]|uniref:Tryptophan synthase alpha chain n=1 Tax=Desulfosarcina alkanivorans TaxID=571177 RepID=A0A5K7YZ03_9BACT|nr:tryptophan synthase subunit alpha [Desulfosarcina alkanivorans]BBO71504.1 tryptophan synthase alpha chain [Desulfosarcina alkanivorans]
MLESYIRSRLQQKPILLMTHIVIGYPSLQASMEIVRTMVAAGVDLMELQIPFSEPIADGPVILKANQQALASGITVGQCLDFGRQAAREFPIPFLYMTYYNILFKHGVDRFAEGMKDAGVHGAIVPDLPPEEADGYLGAMGRHQLAPIFIYSPTTSEARMSTIARVADGFVYCVARKGVTGDRTAFSRQIGDYLARCRAATHLPLALGFGVKDQKDVEFLTGKADIAVIGTQAMRVMEDRGVGALRAFIRDLGQP